MELKDLIKHHMQDIFPTADGIKNDDTDKTTTTTSTTATTTKALSLDDEIAQLNAEAKKSSRGQGDSFGVDICETGISGLLCAFFRSAGKFNKADDNQVSETGQGEQPA